MPLCPARRAALAGRAARVAAVTCLGLAGAAVAAPPAAAHSDLASSTPADGAQLARPPATVTLRFTDDIEPRFATVTLSAGTGEPAPLPTRVDGSTLTAEPPTDTAPGAWRVAYRVVSDDGHPISGVLTFTVATPATTPTPPTAAPTASASSPAARRSVSATPSAAPTSAATAAPTAADAARDAWWKWPTVIVVALTLMAAPAAAALRGLGQPSATGPPDDNPRPDDQPTPPAQSGPHP